MIPTARLQEFRRRLLSWYESTGRDLPWRRTRDPYGVLVSESMLQQTQAARVEEAWQAFMSRFPTVQALASASTANVLDAWRGLGYNRRAVNLHRAAQRIAVEHRGVVPAEVDVLETLPGVGPYTARAVATFAYGRTAAPVDTNIRRVLTRGIAGTPLAPSAVQRLADAVVPGDVHPGERGTAGDDVARRPGEGPAQDDPALWSHALMDLGARRCIAAAPRCATCPVASVCAWRLAGQPDPDPAAAGTRTRPPGRFQDSDRYHRGRIVDALREGDLEPAVLGRAADLDDVPRLERLVGDLVREGLAEWCEGRLTLPGRTG